MTARTKIGRRALCAAPAALLLPAAGMAAAGAHPDQPLLDACAAFDDVTRRVGDYCPGGATPIHDDDERDLFLAPLCDRQIELIDLLCRLRATTPAGFAARAVSMAVWQPKWSHGPDDGAKYHDDGLVAALLRDLVAARGAA